MSTGPGACRISIRIRLWQFLKTILLETRFYADTFRTGDT